VSFVDSGDNIYIKLTMTLNNNKVEFPNNKLRMITKIYSQDNDPTFEPVEMTNIDVSKYSWKDLVKETIKDYPNSKKLTVDDRLFSFKKIPNTNSFLFSVEWARNRWMEKTPTVGDIFQFERPIFLYDRRQGTGALKKIYIFNHETDKYSFPKIQTFSGNNKYVSLWLFGCWNCGGHQPETWLLDLQTLKMKNIGRVIDFSWGQGGTYTYKDYVEIDCKEPQPVPCTKDPNTLPLKTEQM
jgi:hypothetical protein